MASNDERRNVIAELLTCKINPLNQHIYKISVNTQNKNEYPKFLPCGNTLCDKCIQDFIKSNENEKNIDEINCPLCGKTHSLDSIKSSALIENKTLVAALELYKQQIASYLRSKLLAELEELNNKQKSVDEYFLKLNAEIDKRYASVKNDSKMIQIRIYEEMLKKRAKISYFKINRNLPELKDIISLSFSSAINLLENIGSVERKNYNLESYFINIDDIIMLNAFNYVVSGISLDYDEIIAIFDKEFKFDRKLDTIEFKNSKIQLSSDFKENFLILARNLNEIRLYDINDLQKVKVKFGNKLLREEDDDEKYINDPIDVCLHENLVYVLDSSKSIKIYNLSGAYEKVIYLYVPNLKSDFYDIIEIKNPQEFAILNNLLVVSSNNETLCIFNLDGDYLQGIEFKGCVMCPFDEKYLLKLNPVDKILICYEKSNTGDQSLAERFSKKLDTCVVNGNNNKSLKLRCCNKRLLIINENKILLL